jgi:hypothetical protein
VQVYAVFSKLGFEQFAYLEPLDQSTLATVRKFVVFRQGEVWQDITAELTALAGDDESLLPTEGDQVTPLPPVLLRGVVAIRERHISGI